MIDPSQQPIGRRLVARALWGVGGFVALLIAWTMVKAVQNPDVRSRRPRWLQDGVPFDVAFWTPLLLTVLIGGGVVGYILWRALRRLDRGDDLYTQRYGRGLRRRGERHIESDA